MNLVLSKFIRKNNLSSTYEIIQVIRETRRYFAGVEAINPRSLEDDIK